MAAKKEVGRPYEPKAAVSGVGTACGCSGTLISQAVRRPGIYVTKGQWENGDRSLCTQSLRDLWLVSLMVKVNPQAAFAGTPTIRVWDSFRTPTVPPAAPNDPSADDDYLVLEEGLTNVLAPFKWEPTILMNEEAVMQYGDGRLVRTVYYLRYFFQLGLRVQLLDEVGGNYTVVANSMHMTCSWMV